MKVFMRGFSSIFARCQQILNVQHRPQSCQRVTFVIHHRLSYFQINTDKIECYQVEMSSVQLCCRKTKQLSFSLMPSISYLHVFQLDILRILEARLVSCMVLPSTSEFPALEFLVYPISLMLRCPRELSCTGESSPAYDGYMVVIRSELE